ncbi:hypothetical protein C0585_04290 [Candidatus Woesearchaeota archaeon]|nr:MAG: hypothetical protein C0585_04290 [Candidatus Woesearchaeota archaeon]
MGLKEELAHFSIRAICFGIIGWTALNGYHTYKMNTVIERAKMVQEMYADTDGNGCMSGLEYEAFHKELYWDRGAKSKLLRVPKYFTTDNELDPWTWNKWLDDYERKKFKEIYLNSIDAKCGENERE